MTSQSRDKQTQHRRSAPLIEFDWSKEGTVRELTGHGDHVNSVSWSPNGLLLASGSDDGIIRIWETANGQQRHKWSHDHSVTSLSWSPDSTSLACASKDKTVRIWHEARGTETCVLEGHKNNVNAVAWSPDGKHMVSVSSDKTLRIWDPITGEERRVLRGHAGVVTSVCWSPDSAELVSGDKTGVIRFWDALTGSEKWVMQGHEGRVTSLTLSPQGTHLASASSDKTILIWSLNDRHQDPQILSGHHKSVTSVAWSPNGRNLASGSSDHTILIWDWTTVGRDRRMAQLKTLSHQGKTVLSLCWNPSGTELASGSRDHHVRIIKPERLHIKDVPLSGGPRLIGSTVRSFDRAALAWKAGDVPEAWRIIGELCNASWVLEVLDELGLTSDQHVVGKRDHHEMSRSIRDVIEKRISEESAAQTPSLISSLAILDTFLKETSGDKCIEWLRESVRHTIERHSDTKQPLRVALLGEFSSGKSRLINALLGEKILSTGIVPVTRSVTRIVHSSTVNVKVRYVDGAEVVVPVGELQSYTDERKRSDSDSPVAEVILGHPSPMLKKVELWDTPGFNSSNQLHDEVATQLLLEADAVLWILSSYQVGSRSESKLLETVQRAQGKVVAVLNQTDRLDGEGEIKKQVSEVKKHCGDSVEEVVPTSAKWIEDGHVSGNREELMKRIQQIGSWSQERRLARTVRRVAAVAAQARICLLLRESEKKQIKQLRRKVLLEAKDRRVLARTLWKEAKEHHTNIHATNWSIRNPLDPWFTSRCAHRTPLTLAYRSLLHEELSTEGYEALLQCLRTLEEVHLHVSPHDPVPWRGDFLVSWQKGMESTSPKSLDYLFQERTPQYGDAHRWLRELVSVRGLYFPERWAGMIGHGSRISKVLTTLGGLPSDSEIRGWWKTLDKTTLDVLTPDRPPWRKHLDAVLHLAPGRRCQVWVDREERVFELIQTYQPAVGAWLLAREETERSRFEFKKESERLCENHREQLSVLEKKSHELSERIGRDVKEFNKRLKMTGETIKEGIIGLKKQVIDLKGEIRFQPASDLPSLLSQVRQRYRRYSNDLVPNALRENMIADGIALYFLKRGLPVLLGLSLVIYLLPQATFLLPYSWMCSPPFVLWWIMTTKKHLQKSFLNSNVELQVVHERRKVELAELTEKWTALREEKLTISKNRKAAIKQALIWQREMKSIKANPPEPKESPHFQKYQEHLLQLERYERQARVQKRKFMRSLRTLFPERKSREAK
jgi:ribosome biogenesis GTPase A